MNEPVVARNTITIITNTDDGVAKNRLMDQKIGRVLIEERTQKVE